MDAYINNIFIRTAVPNKKWVTKRNKQYNLNKKWYICIYSDFLFNHFWKKWHSKNLCRKLYPIPQGPFKKILLEDILILNQTMENYIYIYLSDKTVPLHWRKCIEIPGMHSVSIGNTWYRVYYKARMACVQV